jgi:hypothetical protein
MAQFVYKIILSRNQDISCAWDYAIRYSIEHGRSEILGFLLQDPYFADQVDFALNYTKNIHDAIRRNAVECYKLMRAKKPELNVDEALTYIETAELYNRHGITLLILSEYKGFEMQMLQRSLEDALGRYPRCLGTIVRWLTSRGETDQMIQKLTDHIKIAMTLKDYSRTKELFKIKSEFQEMVETSKSDGELFDQALEMLDIQMLRLVLKYGALRISDLEPKNNRQGILLSDPSLKILIQRIRRQSF